MMVIGRNRPAFSNQLDGKVCRVASGTCFVESLLLLLNSLHPGFSPCTRTTNFGYAANHQETDGFRFVPPALNGFRDENSLSLHEQAAMKVFGELRRGCDETRPNLPIAG